MFGREKIPSIREDIAKWAEQLRLAHDRAASLYAHGDNEAQKLDGFFESRLQQQLTSTHQFLSKQPTDWVAGWEDSIRWQGWDPSDAHEFRWIRIGDLAEKRGGLNTLIPGFVPFIGQNRTVFLRSGGESSALGLELLQSLVIRTALMLPHQARYTLIDPFGAGRAFPMRRYLPHVRDNSGDVRRDLEGVMADIQRIIETYLDARVTSFEQVPDSMRVNEAYHFVFAADFPKNYDRRAIEALRSIGNTGALAGVYLFVHYNTDYEMPRDQSLDDFENAFVIDIDPNKNIGTHNLLLTPDAAPPPDVQTNVFEILQATKPPERIIYWDEQKQVEAEPANWWKGDSTEFIQTQIGVHGNDSPLYLWFGAQDGRPCAHGMLGAMTGSGKSNMYHVLIAGLVTQYSPDDLRLYLIDGKDGVELQAYRHLPHAEVVSLRSSPELSRSVLAELIAEKERRNDLFTEADTRSFAEYRAKGQPLGSVPRILLLVDEYQELFEGDRDGLASDMLLQLAAQGRSAGIHMFLGSQHFGAAGMINRQKILGNFHLRAAMMMTSDDIQALTEFGRKGKSLIANTCDLPGKIVVNDRSGDDSGNLAGKIAFLPSENRDELLTQLDAKAEASGIDLPPRVILDGKRQPNILDNPQFSWLLHHHSWLSPQELETIARKPLWDDGFNSPSWFAGEHPYATWLGQDFSVRGQVMAIIRRRITENIMVVGNANAERFGMLAAIITSLSVNISPVGVRFFIVDCGIPGTPWGETLEDVNNLVLRPARFRTQFTRDPDAVEDIVNKLIVKVDRRKSLTREEQAEQPEIYFVAGDLERVDGLRRQVGTYGMSSSPLGEQLARVYAEGPPLGIHCIFSFPGIRPMASVIDDRSGLPFFRHRIATQMSEDASHTFVRSRLASRLQIDGPTPVCALYFDVDNDYSVRFKPYSTRDQSEEDNLTSQLREIGDRLSQRSMPS